MPTRTLIRNGIVLPMSGPKVALDPGSVLVEGDTIVAVGPVEQLDAYPRSEGAEVVDASGQFKLNGTFERGYTKTLGGEPPYRISIGNVNGARITVDGEPLDLKPHFNGRLVRLTLDPRRATKPE